jgi:hypothetical protein
MELTCGGVVLLEFGSIDTLQVITNTSDTSAGCAPLGVSLHLNAPEPVIGHNIAQQIQVGRKL